jgi:hypothetical protein
VLEFGPMVTILVNQCRSKEKANRYALLWPVWVCAVVRRCNYWAGCGNTSLLVKCSAAIDAADSFRRS